MQPDDTQTLFIVGGLLAVAIAFELFMRHLEAPESKRLPKLDRTPRTATVVGGQRFRGTMLIEVEYTDGDGILRRECLADVFPRSDEAQFAIGTTWQVYGFRKPQGRCLLTEAHDDLDRTGYNLDGVRLKKDRTGFGARPGSPVLGVLAFRGDGWVKGGMPVVAGRRTSWPGYPASAWEWAEKNLASVDHRRPRPRKLPDRGVLCDVFDSPLTMTGSDVDSETRILVDVRVPDAKARRIVAAFTSWASAHDARDAWGPVPLTLFYTVITGEELFGPDGAGGYIARDCTIEPGKRALITPDDSGEYPDAPFRRAQVSERR